MNERAMLVLLQEWYRQLAEALDTAKAAFPDPEPHLVRRWTSPFALMLRPPTDDDPPDRWKWVDANRTPPHLQELESTIDRISMQIEELKGGT